MFFLTMAAVAVCGYLLGSINPAVLVSRRMYRKDVRNLGSGNAGMTNMLRNFGKVGAAFTLLADILKGVLAVLCGRGISWLIMPETDLVYGAYIGAIGVIIGHVFPVFFGFKGGKGIATSLGVILALQPLVALILLSIFLVLVAIWRIVSLASVVAIICSAPITFLWYQFVLHRNSWFAIICTVIITAIVVCMHRENLKRIVAGTEYRFGDKKKNAVENPASEPAQK